MKRYDGIDYDFRPDTYWSAADPLALILGHVKGTNRRQMIRDYWEAGVLKALDDPDEKVRWRAATGLAELSPLSDETVEKLFSRLSAEPPEDNELAARHYRRVTQILSTGSLWDVRVLVFSAEHMETDLDELIADPDGHRVRSQIQTLVSR